MTIDHYGSARDMAGAVRTKQISARELLDVHLDRIEATNTSINAIVSLDVERAPSRRHGPTSGGPAMSRSVHCTVCRSPSRTPTRSVAGVRRSARH